jgi:glycosyltransferase involved in cell wall biosynthesis
MKNHLVSVIVPCYNHGMFLEETVRSVLNSTWPNIEIIIIDDGSTDNSSIIAKKIVDQYKNVRCIFQNNSGPSVARNNGILAAKGKFILALDADDLISPRYIEAAVKEFDKDPELKVVYCEAEKFGAKSGKWKLDDFSLEKLAYKNMIFVSALFKKTDWQKSGGFAEEMTWGFEDWEFWISLLKTGGKVKKLPFVGFYYRIQKNSRRKSVDSSGRRKTVDFINKKHRNFIHEQLGGPLHYQKSLSKFINRFRKK